MYEQNVRERIFVEGQLVLIVADYIRRNIAAPSKFAPNWEDLYVVKEAYGNRFYHLCRMDKSAITDPVNGRWLKLYHA